MIKRQKINVALPEELLNSFAKALVPEIRTFCESAIYKTKLKKNEVMVMSVQENISDDASGILYRWCS